jgi:uncharacterized sporulation protein YeaH/YhbH (DUF444 family)
MSIVIHDDWTTSEKGRKDVARHREKVDAAIRNSIVDVIAETSIISGEGGTVRIPIKELKDYRFRYRLPNKITFGVGSGNRPNKSCPDNNMIEVEVDIDYLINILFEKLGLPYIKPKNKKSRTVNKIINPDGLNRYGKYPLIHKKKTIEQSLKRSLCEISCIINETNCSDDIGKKAYVQSHYNVTDAVTMIRNNKVDINGADSPLFSVDDDDIYYNRLAVNTEEIGKAVFIMIIDTSGSMNIDKKFLARTLGFWTHSYIKSQYEEVEIRFIVHTDEAKLVNENEFFRQGEYGATLCHTGFDLANKLIETDYNPRDYNIYIQYIGDGEDMGINQTLKSIEKLKNKDINLICYAEICPESEWTPYNVATLLPSFIKKFNMHNIDNLIYISDDLKLVGGIIKSSNDVAPYLYGAFNEH